MDLTKCKVECQAQFEIWDWEDDRPIKLSEFFHAVLELYQATDGREFLDFPFIFVFGFIEVSCPFVEAIEIINGHSFDDLILSVLLPDNTIHSCKIIFSHISRADLAPEVRFAVISTQPRQSLFVKQAASPRGE